MKKQLLLTPIFLMSIAFFSHSQTVLLQESFETDGEGVRYTSNAFYSAASDFFTRMNNNPTTYALGNGVGTHPTNPNGSFYWGAEDCDVATGGEGVITLNALAVTGYDLDVTVGLANGRPNDFRLETADYFILEYNLDGGGWNIFGALYGNNGTGSGNLQVDADLNGSPDPAGAEVNSSNFQDFNFSIPTAGNSLQLRLRVLANTGSESIIFDNIRINGTLSSPSPGAWDGSTSTDWNVASNWTGNVVPTAADDITIPAAPSNQPHVTLDPGSPAVCNDITIDAGATLTVDAGKALTISGTLANAGTILIEADATGIGSFIDNGTITGSGSFQMEQYLTGSGGATPDGVFYYVSSPTASATSNVYNAAGTDRLWSADETTQSYPEITDNATALTVGKGYIARLGATSTLTYTGGAYNTGNISASGLTRTGTTATNRGYNLVSNPYPSTVNWDDLGRTNLETTMWYRTHQGTTMLFDTYNATGQVGTNNNGGGAVDGTIPPTQAFWVRVDADGNTGTLSFENVDRSHGMLSSIYRMAAEEGTVRLTISNGEVSDETIILFDASAQDTYDDYDSQKFWASSSVPQLYTSVGTDTLVINGLTSTLTNPVVALGMKVPATEEYTIDATSITVTGESVHLEDRALNIFQDLNAEPSYTFTTDGGHDPDRFAIHFGLSITDVESAEKSSTRVYSNGSQLTVQLPENTIGMLTVLDVSGRELYSTPLTESNSMLELNVNSGIYLVNVSTDKGLDSHKVVLK